MIYGISLEFFCFNLVFPKQCHWSWNHFSWINIICYRKLTSFIVIWKLTATAFFLFHALQNIENLKRLYISKMFHRNVICVVYIMWSDNWKLLYFFKIKCFFFFFKYLFCSNMNIFFKITINKILILCLIMTNAVLFLLL